MPVMRFPENRPHYKKDISHKARRVDAERYGCSIEAPRAKGYPSRLPCIKKIADKYGNCGTRKHGSGYKSRRKTADKSTENANKHELQQIIDKEPEKTIKIASNKPGSLRIFMHRKNLPCTIVALFLNTSLP
jgi:hypothetical protein